MRSPGAGGGRGDKGREAAAGGAPGGGTPQEEGAMAPYWAAQRWEGVAARRAVHKDLDSLAGRACGARYEVADEGVEAPAPRRKRRCLPPLAARHEGAKARVPKVVASAAPLLGRRPRTPAAPVRPSAPVGHTKD
mmetsp:Transcript_47264/g.143115  ORF Transcript_47264/g.143115 Transcript_47264/m.143115 type:complete len:135 (+) Transcript_47264:1133-1537(+)